MSEGLITSISEVSTFLRCRRKWDYYSSSRMNLTTVGVGKSALELGSLIHAALEDWNNDIETDPVEHFKKHAHDRLMQICLKYQEVNGFKISSNDLVPLYESIDLGLAMMQNYKKHYGKPLPPDMEFAVMEQEIIVEIPGTPHKLRVKLDGLLRNKNGVYFVLERKTYGSRPNLDVLESNSQFIGYIWAVRQAKFRPVAGIAYDGMWKRSVPPKGKTLEDLFLRRPIQFTNEVIEEWGRNLALIVTDMASNPTIYTNRRWEGCSDCNFEKLCGTQSRGEDYEWMARTHYTQREDNKPKGIILNVTQ